MDRSLDLYLGQLEVMAFFSGYPLIYLIVLSFAGKKSARSAFKQRIVSRLPLAYALTGILFLGLQLRNLYPDFSLLHIKATFQYLMFKIWGLLSVSFMIPVLRKKTVLSLLHSLVFFYLLLRDIFLHLFSASVDKYALQNEMKVYTDSLLLNIATLAGVTIFFFLIAPFRKNNNSSKAL